MTTKHETLQAKLLAKSKADNWADAQLEWVVEDIWEEPGGSCDCGHTPITDHLLIRNTQTDATLVVGNVCVSKFFDWEDYGKIFEGIKRLKKDPTIGTPEILLRVTLFKDALDEYKLEFLQSRKRTRKLSEKQRNFRIKCHKIILFAWSQHCKKIREQNVENI